VSFYLVRVEAVQWSGSNWHECYALAEKKVWVTDSDKLNIRTEDGDIARAAPGWWLVKRGEDDYTVVRDEVFRANYEEIEA
jgi:hypothetical protein